MTDNRAGNMGIRIIVFMGMGTCLFLLLVSFTLSKTLKPREEERVPEGKAQSPFQAERAWKDLEYIVGLGPRPSGSDAMRKQQQYVLQALKRAGLRVQRQDFDADTPRGPIAMSNVWGIVEGSQPGVILLSNHYDTKFFADFPFLGANDGASTTAWMLEMARALGPRREGRSIWLVFFDGEEAIDTWSPTDGLYGSRKMVSALTASGELDAVEALINIDMIGDCYLAISQDADAPLWMTDIILNTARRKGYESHFDAFPLSIEDDHIPFRDAGIPALELIDFSYGGSRLEHKQNWHTARDTLDKLCPASLRAVGDVIYHALPAIDGQLNSVR